MFIFDFRYNFLLNYLTFIQQRGSVSYVLTTARRTVDSCSTLNNTRKLEKQFDNCELMIYEDSSYRELTN